MKTEREGKPGSQMPIFVVTILLSFVAMVTVLLALRGEEAIYTQIALLLVSTIGAIYVTYFLRTLSKNATPVRVAVIGQPNSGKSVYLTVLFNELQSLQTPDIIVRAYGVQTIEKVAKNLSILSSGRWLGRTANEIVFPFRANAKILRAGGLFSRRYTVEIGDYAGERAEEFDSSSERWLHRTDYFKYVISSDVVFLAVDGEVIQRGKVFELQEMENKLIAAFQVLIEEKGIPIDKKLEVPVGLLILKRDLIKTDELKSMGRLQKVCSNRCLFFKVFFVSSVGSVNANGDPPATLMPLNVVEPMIWALKHLSV